MDIMTACLSIRVGQEQGHQTPIDGNAYNEIRFRFKGGVFSLDTTHIGSAS